MTLFEEVVIVIISVNAIVGTISSYITLRSYLKEKKLDRKLDSVLKMLYDTPKRIANR